MSDLRATAIGVSYGDVVAVRRLDLHVPAGRTLSVTGPSGAGKSSLLRALACAVDPAVASVTGTVEAGGSALSDRETAARSGVVLVPQGNGLAPSLSARENVLVPLLVLGVPAPQAASRADEQLARVGLSEFGRHLVDQLATHDLDAAAATDAQLALDDGTATWLRRL